MDRVRSFPWLRSLFVAIAAVGTASGRAADWPADTDAIKSLTADEARQLVADFPGADVEIEVPRTDRDLLGNALPRATSPKAAAGSAVEPFAEPGVVRG